MKTLTTKELIEKLQKLDPDLVIVLSDYSDDSDEQLNTISPQGAEELKSDKGERFNCIFWNADLQP